MPQMANITVKAANGTTDVVYTAMTPASGDGTAAQWRAEGSGASAAVRATVSCTSKYNGPKTARRVVAEFQLPQVATVDGVETVMNRVPVGLTIAVPLNAPDSVIDEAVAQATNFFSSPLFRNIMKTGYAAS